MLLTSRETRRWVIPKGWPIRGAKPHVSAAREAREEAGVLGKTVATAIGTHHYYKRLEGGIRVRCKVKVFPLEVKSQRKRWREKGLRKVRWFELTKAAKAVQEPGLRRLSSPCMRQRMHAFMNSGTHACKNPDEDALLAMGFVIRQ